MTHPVPDVRANVVTLLKDAAARSPAKAALVCGGRTVSYGELWGNICSVSAALRGRGILRGDRIVIMIPMSPELYESLLAILKIGAVAVFVDPWIPMKQIAAFAAFAEPKGFFGVPKSHLLRLLDRKLRRLPITVTTSRRLLSLPAKTGIDELRREPPDDVIAPVAVSDPALVTFTTGSSGTPKGANRTHGFLGAQHAALQHEFPYRDEDVDLSMFPVFALNNLARGITTVIPQMDFSRVAELDGDAIAREIERRSVTTVTASPPFFDRVGAAFRSRGLRLRRLLAGGAAITDAQLHRWRGQFPETEIVVVYGSTEAEPIAHLTADERLEVSGADSGAGVCMGVPSTLCRTKVVAISSLPLDASRGWSGIELARGSIGELVVAGDHVCRDYFRNAEAIRQNKIPAPDGSVWHRMGDTGYFDERGRFWLVGRVHSTIERDGKLYHAGIIEEAARSADERVKKAAAIGIGEKADGQRLVIVIETAADQSRWDEMRANVERNLRTIEVIADEIVLRQKPLPVDPRHNSKIRYQELRGELST